MSVYGSRPLNAYLWEWNTPFMSFRCTDLQSVTERDRE
jgi:hypothetical protein